MKRKHTEPHVTTECGRYWVERIHVAGPHAGRVELVDQYGNPWFKYDYWAAVSEAVNSRKMLVRYGMDTRHRVMGVVARCPVVLWTDEHDPVEEVVA